MNISENIQPKLNKMYKAVLIGDVSVGKTSIVNQLINGTFYTDSTTTMGAVFFKYPSLHQESNYSGPIYHIWDTAGQERYRSLVPLYLKNSGVIIIVYDANDVESLHNIRDIWYPFIKKHLSIDMLENTIIFIVANKIDLYKENDQYNYLEEGLQLANSLGIYFAKASAKTGEGIRELFD